MHRQNNDNKCVCEMPLTEKAERQCGMLVRLVKRNQKFSDLVRSIEFSYHLKQACGGQEGKYNTCFNHFICDGRNSHCVYG